MLEKINSPQDLRKIPQGKLPEIAKEIRQYVLGSVSKTGGHLAPSLGAVDVILSLHYCLDTPNDTIVWDVGHQAYAHKILTGRKEKFHTLRKSNGLSGFPNIHESEEHDFFTVGHGSTSISTALGLAAARSLKKSKEKIAAFIGDGSLGGGMAFEALNHAGQLQEDIIIILNDNEFSISPSVGAFSKYLNRVISNPIYNKIRTQMQDVIKRIPRLGSRALRAANRLEESLKNLLVPGIIFEEMGIRYFGPVDGHDINAMVEVIRNIMPMKEPRLIHVITKKGKGYKPAENNPSKFHGTSSFDLETGQPHIPSGMSFTKTFSQSLINLAEENKKIVAITAAMPEGTGLISFKEKFPERFFNVGMAEEHAVGFAAGLAKKGLIPVVAIYSTFLQRSYDQIIHDVALQNLHVVMCLDRGGVVGEDGPTHHGVFDMAYMRHIPNVVCMAPKDHKELTKMLEFAAQGCKGPVSIRYPRGSLIDACEGCRVSESKIELGKAEVLKVGTDLALLSIGSMGLACLKAAHILADYGISAEVINARFIKPLDEELIKSLCERIQHIITVEDGCVKGGFGSAVLELISGLNTKNIKVQTLGLPDEFLRHASRKELLKDHGLCPEKIAESVKRFVRTKEAV